MNDSGQLGSGKDNLRLSDVSIQSNINITSKLIKGIDTSSIMIGRGEFKINGTEKQFDLVYDATEDIVNIITNHPYTKVGGELSYNANIDTANMNISMIYKDSIDMYLISYSINNDQYVELEDIAEVLNFKVEIDLSTYVIHIDTNSGFDTELM